MTIQQSPYLRNQRNFPHDDIQKLTVEIDKSYIDIAQKVNARVIGIFANNFQIVTGEEWYLNGQPTPQQGLRQVYQFTGAGSIPHGINFSTVSFVSHPFGSYTDGTNWYGAIYASSTAIGGQVTFYITPTNIVVVVDGAAPAITSGIICLEWVSQF
jgi:hypothetical protein